MGKFYESVYEELSLYVRQSAWLDAVPDEPEGQKVVAQKNVPKYERITRRRKLLNEKKEPEIPDVDCGDYLLAYLWEVGPVMAAGMGNGPITFCELRAWEYFSGIALRPFESSMLRQLSQDYLAEAVMATNPDRDPPFGQSLRRLNINKKLDLFLD